MPDVADHLRAAAEVLQRSDRPRSAELEQFLTHCGDGVLRFQHCLTCDYVRFLASPICPECLSTEYEWRADSGAGTIWSFCVYHRAFAPEFRDLVPYAVCLVELDSGPRLITNPVDLPLDRLAIGARGRVIPLPIEGGLAVPFFFAGARDE